MKTPALRVFAGAFATLASSTIAADGTWISNASGNWSDTVNWSGGVVADLDGFTAAFNTDLTSDVSVNLDSPRNIGNLFFTDSDSATAASWSLSGNPLTLAGGTPTITVQGLGTGASATVNTALQGSAGLRKEGAGTLNLGAQNVYSGGTFVNAGTLNLTSGGGPGTIRGEVTVASGAILQLSATDALGYTGGQHVTKVTLGENAQLVNSAGGNNGWATHFDLTGASMTTPGGGNFTLGYYSGGSTSVTTHESAITSSISNINLRGDNGNTNVNFTVADGAAATDLTVGSISNSGGTSGITKLGAGTMNITGNANYEGATVVSAGRLNTNGQLRGTTGVQVGPGATMQIGGTNVFVADHGTALAASRALSVDAGTLIFASNFVSRFGNVNLANGATWNSDEPLSAWGAVLADTTAGAASITVANTGGNTSASVMGGSGGIRLAGQQIFNVSDVTGSAAADLIVSMQLAAQGNMTGAAGAVLKTGDGTMAFTRQMSYDGNTVVNGGVLELTGGGGSGGTIRGTVDVNNGSTLRLAANDVTGYGTGTDRLHTLNINEGSHLEVTTTGGSGSNQTLGNAAINLTGATMTGIGGTTMHFFQGSSSLNSLASANSSTVSNMRLGIRQNGGLVVTVADGAADQDLVINAEIYNEGSYTNSSLKKDGAGTLVFNGIKTYSSGTVVNGGVLDLASGGGSTGVIRGTVDINNGALLRLSGGDVTGYSAGTDSLKVININQGGEMRTTTLSNQTLGNAVVNLTAGKLSGIDGSNLDFFQGSSAINSLAAASSSVVEGTSISIRQNNGLTVNVADGAAEKDLIISSQIQRRDNYSNQVLRKEGAGTLELTANNIYDRGTEINAGRVLVNNTAGSGTGTGFVNVNNTATLGGAGTIGTAPGEVALTINSGGTLAPGNSPGTLTVNGNTVFGTGATYLVDVAAGGVGTATDLLVNNGTVSLNGATLSVNWGGSAPANIYQPGTALTTENGFWIVNNDGTDAIDGTFGNTMLSPELADLFPGTTPYLFTDDGQRFAVFYNADYMNSLTGGNDILLVAIPEPARAMLALFAASGILFRRRRN